MFDADTKKTNAKKDSTCQEGEGKERLDHEDDEDDEDVEDVDVSVTDDKLTMSPGWSPIRSSDNVIVARYQTLETLIPHYGSQSSLITWVKDRNSIAKILMA